MDGSGSSLSERRGKTSAGDAGMTTVVACDVGGTYARFTLAELNGDRVVSLAEAVKLRTADYVSFEAAWQEFGRRCREPLPPRLAMAFAGPVGGDVLKLTNNGWAIEPRRMKERLRLERVTIVNDFGAVAHAVARLTERDLHHVCGPDRPLPRRGVISIIGPGTGLGVAALLQTNVDYLVLQTEGGHIDFAALDDLEERIAHELRRKFGRVSAERVVSGPGLWNLYEALRTFEGEAPAFLDEMAVWDAAMSGTDDLAQMALDRLCCTLGSVAGDMALAHGAAAVVLAGGVGTRIGDYLPRSGFHDRFIAKGRFEGYMADLPVKLIAHPEPGLFGAAAAFYREHG